MKTILFLCAIFFLLSCKKETNPTFSGSVTMKINGEMKQLNVENISPFPPFASNLFSIKFYDGNVTNLFLSVQKTGDIASNSTIIFPFGVSSDGAGAGLTTDIVKDDVYYFAPIAAANAPQGSVLISKWTDNEIEGTFSFNAVGQNKPNAKVSVKEGKFSVRRN